MSFACALLAMEVTHSACVGAGLPARQGLMGFPTPSHLVLQRCACKRASLGTARQRRHRRRELAAACAADAAGTVAREVLSRSDR